MFIKMIYSISQIMGINSERNKIPFVESLKDVDLKWVGSSNQHVINVKERINKIKTLSENIV